MPGQLNSFMFLNTQIRSHLQYYPCPSNLSLFWNFGFLLGITFITQIVTGLILACRYCSDPAHAFTSVQHILREVSYGWQFRYLHATGATCLFVCLYLHIFRALYYTTYTYLNHAWITGFFIYVISVAAGFLGYVLPWGQMSFWGATVICNLLSPIPYLVTWLLGGFYVDSPTLRRFFVLHFVLPFIALFTVVLHIFYLHLNGSSNPIGTETALKIPFYPTLLTSDGRLLFGYLILFFFQTYFGIFEVSHPDNNITVNRFITPLQIVPEWYFLAFYAMLKAIPSKSAGVLFVMADMLGLFSLGEAHGGPRKTPVRTHVMNKSPSALWFPAFINSAVGLVITGSQIPQHTFILYGKIFTSLNAIATYYLFTD